MCDYSLYNVKNRLASEMDDLVLHRFDTGSIGFCAAAELQKEMVRSSWARNWSSFLRWLFPRKACGLTAVCVPPGSRLLVTQVPGEVCNGFEALAYQTVEFTQLTAQSFAYRDAVRLAGGVELLLQRLPVGLRATVMSLAPAEEPVFEEAASEMLRTRAF